MACGTFLQNPQQSDRRPQRDPGYPPPDCWLGPRISFSNDFPRPAGGGVAALASREIMKEISEVKDSPARATGKESPAEFEFSQSIHGCLNSHGTTMLPADELFYEGKLLPLYMPQHLRESELAATRQGKNNPTEFVQANGIIEQMTDYSIASGAPLSASQRMDSPLSPKAPTCTCRWKDLFGLKKMQSQDASGCKPQLKSSKHPSSSDHFLVPGRISDAGNDSRGSALRSESQNHAVCFLQDQSASSPYVYSFLSEPSSTADPGLNPAIHAHNWPMDRAMSGSRSSKSSDDSEGAMETRRKMQKPEGGATTVVKHRNSISRARSPVKSSELRSAAMSPRRGSRGVSPGRPSVGNRPTESSRNAIAARLVVRGLDRSYSSPKPMRKRPEQQARSGKQRADGSRSLERSTSYSASVRVSPVINMPVYISPGLRKGSKNGIFGLSQLFSSKKEKKASKL